MAIPVGYTMGKSGFFYYLDGSGPYCIDTSGVPHLVGGNVDAVTWANLTGNPQDNAALVAFVGGFQAGGPSDLAPLTKDAQNRLSTFLQDGLVWTITYLAAGPATGYPDTFTTGAVVRQYQYNGLGEFNGVTGPAYIGGSLRLPIATMLSLTPVTAGMKVVLEDKYPGQEFSWNNPGWKAVNGTLALCRPSRRQLLYGMNATGAPGYVRTGTAIVVTKTGHGLTAAMNGCDVYLNPTSGAMAAGFYRNFQYVDANTFNATDPGVGGNTSGTLGTVTSEITFVTTPGIAGGISGTSYALTGKMLQSVINNANNKRFRCRVGGTEIYNPTNQNTVGVKGLIDFFSAGAVDAQVTWPTTSNSGVGQTTGQCPTYAINLAVDQSVTITGQLSVDTDWMIHEGTILNFEH